MPLTLNAPSGFPAPSAARPLAGMTVLLVEDSRLASEAVRLLCLKSGARFRRADSLRSARRHLGSYLPTTVIVDLGLPDGSGLSLIRDLAQATPRIPVILATSGDDSLFEPSLQAGANGVLAKPVESLALFQCAVLGALPAERQLTGPRIVPADLITPDPVTFHDDLARIADVLTASEDGRTMDYIAQFLTGVARCAHDTALENAATRLAERCRTGTAYGSDLARVAGLLQARLQARAAI